MSVRRIGLLLAAYALAGCASGPIGAHQPSLASIHALRQSGMAPAAVGEFSPAAALPPARDKSVSVRGSSLRSPSGSFAVYLRDALIADLRAAGKYEPAAPTVITGELIRNELAAGGVSTANSALGARFAVTRAGATLYDKAIDVTHEWSSSFVGAIAIPEAINQYTQMYTRLLQKLFADPEFEAAVAAE